MLVHPAARFIGIGLANGLINPAVERESMFRLDDLGGDGDEFVERLMNDGEYETGDAVASSLENGLMEQKIVGHKLCVVGLACFQGSKFTSDPRDILIRSASCGAGR